MIRYLTKTTATGTENNKAFKGVSRAWYMGKSNSSDLYATVFEEDVSDIEKSKRALAARCGYTTLRGAKVALATVNKKTALEAEYGFNSFVNEVIEVKC